MFFSQIFVTFHRKTRVIEHFNLGQTVFQTPSNGVCKGFGKSFETPVKGFVKRLKGVCKAFEIVLKEFV